MRLRRSAIPVLLLVGAIPILALTACSSVKVSHTQDPAARLPDFKTFELRPSQTIADEDLRALVGVMIAEQLTAKGLTRVEQDGDLIVTFDGSTGSHEQMATGLGYAVETTGGVTTVYTVSRGVPQGFLVVSLIDPEVGKVVWQATAEAALKANADIDTRLARLEKAIVTMIAPYPAMP